MSKRWLLAALLCAPLHAPSPAGAASLPDPPFAVGGFVSPTKAALKAQLKVEKLMERYLTRNAKCDRKAVEDLNQLFPPIGSGAAGPIQAAVDDWASCRAVGFGGIYGEDVAELVEKGTPACLGESAIRLILDGAEGVRQSLRNLTYCDGDAANPEPVTQLRIPDDPDEATGAGAADKALLTAGFNAGRCYLRVATLAFKNGGSVPASDLAKFGLCLARAIARGQRQIQKLADAGRLPACASVAGLQTQIAGVDSTASGLAALIFCAP